MAKLAALSVAALSSSSSAAVLRANQAASSSFDEYTFENFQQEFRREYRHKSQEYELRLGLFQKSKAEIKAKNDQLVREGRHWHAGVHPFMDWTEAEKESMHGYKPVKRSGGNGASFLTSASKAFSRALLRSNATRWADWVSQETVDNVQGGLGPESGPTLRDQGACGSCWAISAAEAVEAQLQMRGGASQQVSAQALIDCVPNPQHCGGQGGCHGATGELAYTFMRDHGIPLEEDLPYEAHTKQCSAEPPKSRVVVSGWNALPSNKAQPLMNSLANLGPTVVTVAARSWYNYKGGVFDDCEKDVILGHAVLAKGYGTDATNGQKFWLIQNSWGAQWGEEGHIRLLRRDDDDEWCGTDREPQKGVGCDGGPSEVTVCGTCGVLYDSIVPEGVHVERSEEQSSSASSSSSDDATASKDSIKGTLMEMDALLRSRA